MNECIDCKTLKESVDQINLLLNDQKSKYSFLNLKKLKRDLELISEYLNTHKVEINTFLKDN